MITLFKKLSKYKIKVLNDACRCVASVIISEYSRKELVNGACAEAMQAESDSKDTN